MLKKKNNVWYGKYIYCSDFFSWIIIKSVWCGIKNKNI